MQFVQKYLKYIDKDNKIYIVVGHMDVRSPVTWT